MIRVDFSPAILTVLIGLGLGAVVGAAAFASNFCALGAVADIMFAKDWRRMRAWMMAGGAALIGTQALESAGLVNLGTSAYLVPRLSWLALVLGGVMFGFGMSLAGGCVNRALVRIGAGSVKSLITVIVIGIFAALTTYGFLKPANVYLTDFGDMVTLMAPGFDRFLAVFPGINAEAARWVFTAIIGGGMLVFCLRDDWFRATKDQLFGALVIGLTVPAAWLAGEILTAYGGLADKTALNFVPPAADLVQSIAAFGVSGALLGMFTLLGVPVGSFVYAAATGNLSVETFTERADFARHIIGGALMGTGGTLALGCTFGQGLSGLSTLSIGSAVVIASIWFGCVWGIRFFETGSVWKGLRLALRRSAV